MPFSWPNSRDNIACIYPPIKHICTLGEMFVVWHSCFESWQKIQRRRFDQDNDKCHCSGCWHGCIHSGGLCRHIEQPWNAKQQQPRMLQWGYTHFLGERFGYNAARMRALSRVGKAASADNSLSARLFPRNTFPGILTILATSSEVRTTFSSSWCHLSLRQVPFKIVNV